jgi:alpha-beta hydrolase superfamily lysophospholipase
MTRRLFAAVLLVLATTDLIAGSTVGQPATFNLRGKSLTLTIYRPTGTPKGTVIMGSGDVGWVGLGVTLAEFLSGEGYIVVGLNVRQYLSTFTVGKSHLEVTDPPADYFALSEWMRANSLLVQPVIVSGMSEGAALAVLAASSPKNHAWLTGAITMGIPPQAELAWRWTDFTSWITKSETREPSFAPKDFIGSISPLPLVMLQSKKDEYVPEAEFRLQEAMAKPPKKLVLIDASNHRFTDRRQQLMAEYLSALAWIKGQVR